MQGPEFRWGNSGLWARLRGRAPCMTASEGLAEACTGQKGKRAGERGAAPGPVVEATCTAWPWGAALPSCCCTHHPHPWGQNSAAAPGPGAGPCPGSAVASLGLCQGGKARERASEHASSALGRSYCCAESGNRFLPVPELRLRGKLTWSGEAESHTSEN